MAYELGVCDLDPPYRYSLIVRTDAPGRRALLVIQCNPSRASSSGSDPTVGKVAHWAEEHGFARVVYLNLFALISSDPRALQRKRYRTIVGPRNDEVLRGHLRMRQSTVVLAWGAGIPVSGQMYRRRLQDLRTLIDEAGRPVHHVGALSHGSHPRHGRMWNGDNRDLKVLAWSSIMPRP
jgi:hypothetical protein